MAQDGSAILAQTIAQHEQAILEGWLGELRGGGALQTGRIREAELGTQCKTFLSLLKAALAASGTAGSAQGGDAHERLRDMLGEMSRSRALQGFTPTETASFVFSIKKPVFDALREAHSGDGEAIAAAAWASTRLLDDLGLHTMEVFLKSREEVIGRQTLEIAELSTPVVKLWDGIVAIPLIGTLDSARTGIVMENLLQAIVDEGAEIAIIDITGVPTVDTLVAQHLLKTIQASRLMGADCIVSGIRPQIAQTMVHLGVDLDVVSKATLADGLALALRRIGRTIVRSDAAPRATDRA